MRSSSLVLSGLFLAFSLACGGGEKPAETPTPTPPPPPPPVEAPAAPTGTAGAMIGVLECDDYMKKVADCSATLDPATKASFETSQKQVTDAWVTAAATPEGKATLGPGCKAALDAFTCPGAPAVPDAAPKEEGAKGTYKGGDGTSKIGGQPPEGSRIHPKPGSGDKDGADGGSRIKKDK